MSEASTSSGIIYTKRFPKDFLNKTWGSSFFSIVSPSFYWTGLLLMLWEEEKHSAILSLGLHVLVQWSPTGGPRGLEGWRPLFSDLCLWAGTLTTASGFVPVFPL